MANDRIGPVELTEGKLSFVQTVHVHQSKLVLGTLSPATSTLIPTVTDNLYSQGSITGDAVGVYFAPTTQDEVVNGELSWGLYLRFCSTSFMSRTNCNSILGGSDSSKLTGSIGYACVLHLR